MPKDRTHFIEAVKAHAQTHYNSNGWDFCVETMDDAAILVIIGNCRTVLGAIARVREVCQILDSRRRDISSEAF